jgi:hypothetical protein
MILNVGNAAEGIDHREKRPACFGTMRASDFGCRASERMASPASATTCPSGWTKSVANDNKALRLVSGTPGTGGTVAFSTVFGTTATGGFTIPQSALQSFVLPNSLIIVDPGHAHNRPLIVEGGAK